MARDRGGFLGALGQTDAEEFGEGPAEGLDGLIRAGDEDQVHSAILQLAQKGGPGQGRLLIIVHDHQAGQGPPDGGQTSFLLDPGQGPLGLPVQVGRIHVEGPPAGVEVFHGQGILPPQFEGHRPGLLQPQVDPVPGHPPDLLLQVVPDAQLIHPGENGPQGSGEIVVELPVEQLAGLGRGQVRTPGGGSFILSAPLPPLIRILLEEIPQAPAGLAQLPLAGMVLMPLQDLVDEGILVGRVEIAGESLPLRRLEGHQDGIGQGGQGLGDTGLG